MIRQHDLIVLFTIVLYFHTYYIKNCVAAFLPRPLKSIKHNNYIFGECGVLQNRIIASTHPQNSTTIIDGELYRDARDVNGIP